MITSEWMSAAPGRFIGGPQFSMSHTKHVENVVLLLLRRMCGPWFDGILAARH